LESARCGDVGEVGGEAKGEGSAELEGGAFAGKFARASAEFAQACRIEGCATAFMSEEIAGAEGFDECAPVVCERREVLGGFADGAEAFFVVEGGGERVLAWAGGARVAIAERGEFARTGWGESKIATGERVADADVVIEVGERGDQCRARFRAFDDHR
jgi:hypothetical protein